MKLTQKDVAKMFGVSERTIERWIRDEGLPCKRVHDLQRFHRSELLEWAHQRGIHVAMDAPISVREGASPPVLSDALASGGVHYDVAARTREDVLRAVVDEMPETDDLDRELLLQIMLAREALASTGVGEGIAIPHVRSPVVMHVDRPSIGLCFLREPVDFQAIDGKPVDTVFWLVTPTIRSHLFLLSRLSAVLSDAELRDALRRRAPAEEILDRARTIERGLPAPPEGDDDDEETGE
jgi:PTS system nitrogen regulatory IIA component